MTLPKLHYAWIILALCFLGMLAAQGVRLSFGAFVTPWEQTFQVNRSTISFVSFVSFLVYGCSQPVVGRLVDRWGARGVLSLSVLLVGMSVITATFVQSVWQLVIVYGIIASLGFGGASGVAASVAVTKWFQSHRGLAFGIIEAGFATGQLILVPTSLWLIDVWGWQRTMLILGGGTSLFIFPLLGLLIRSTPADIGMRPYGDGNPVAQNSAQQNTDQPQRAGVQTILFSRAFWGLALPFFICGITTTGMIDTHLIPFAHDHGYTTSVTSAAVSLLAAFNIFGTLASGPLADRWDSRRILAMLYGLRAASLVLLITTHQSHWLLIFGAIFGLVDFAVLAPTQLLASQYFSGHSLGFVFGLLSLTHQLGSALGAYIPGLLYDLNGSYTVPFGIAAALLMIGTVLSYGLPHPLRGSYHPTVATA